MITGPMMQKLGNISAKQLVQAWPGFSALVGGVGAVAGAALANDMALKETRQEKNPFVKYSSVGLHTAGGALSGGGLAFLATLTFPAWGSALVAREIIQFKK